MAAVEINLTSSVPPHCDIIAAPMAARIVSVISESTAHGSRRWNLPAIPGGLLAAYLLVWGVGAVVADRGYVGRVRDDGIYFVSAESLREGRGYRLPSRPGDPAERKYPIGLPLLLAAAMKLAGPARDLPSEILAARVVIAAAACVFFALAYLLLRRFKVDPFVALASVTLMSLHPLSYELGDLITSDFVFSAFALAALLLPATAGRVPERYRMFIYLAAGACAAAGLYVRSIGVVLLPALAIQLVPAPRRRVAIICSTIGFILAAVPLQALTMLARGAAPDTAGYAREFAAGWRTWDAGFAQMLRNMRSLWRLFADELFPLMSTNAGLRFATSHQVVVGGALVAVNGAVLIGLARLMRDTWQSFRAGDTLSAGLWTFALLTFAVVLICPWPAHPQYFLPLWPVTFLLFFAGGADVCRRLNIDARTGIRASLSLMIVLAIPAAIGLYHRALNEIDVFRGDARAHNVVQLELQAIQHNVPADGVVITEFPELVYLYTRRQAIPLLEDDDLLMERYGKWDKLEGWIEEADGRPLYLAALRVDSDPQSDAFARNSEMPVTTLAQGPGYLLGSVRPNPR